MTLPPEQLYLSFSDLSESDRPETKICTREGCIFNREPQSVDNFYRKRNGSGKFLSWCRTCWKIIADEQTRKNIEHLQNLEPPTSKVCRNPNCIHLGKSQEISNFSKDKTKKDGLHTQCKDCVHAVQKEWRERNSDYSKEHNALYYSQNKESVKAKNREWAAANPEKVKANHKRYADNNRDLLREQSRARFLNTPIEKRRETSRKHYVKTKISKWAKRVLNGCRTRALAKGLPFDLVPEDLLDPVTGELPKICSVLPHIKLDYAAGLDRRKWASIDRIKPSLGYVKGNVRVISMAANMAKFDADDDII